MLLHDYLHSYNRTHDLKPSTLAHYHWVIRSYERHNGHQRTSDLSADAVTDWLQWLKAHGRSPWTIKQRRISLLVLWRAAWRDGLAPPVGEPLRLRPLHHAPTAWTRSEVKRLIAVAKDRGPFWESLVRAGYDSGLRLGDLLALDVADIRLGLISVQQAKTDRPVYCRLRRATLRAIRRQLGGRTAGLVWPWPHRRECIYAHVRKLVATAAIRPGTFRWLRRSAATACERIAPGSGTTLLGHASRSTTEAWYLDRSQLTRPPLPPL